MPADYLSPSLWSEMRLFAVLLMLLLFPGWALLSISRGFSDWDRVQRTIVAIGISISIFPITFYTLRLFAPAVRLGPLALWMGLILCAVIIGWQIGRTGVMVRPPDALEWVALAAVLLILLTRVWLAHQYPFPAWTDSLHHTLITQLTINTGFLPDTLLPFFDSSLRLYHLGLYSIAASAAWMAQVPAHLALQWTAQVLNACAALGVFLIIDRWAGRIGALTALLYVGIYSHQPAYYFNWGRFTQLSSQVIIPIAWLMTVETITDRGQRAPTPDARSEYQKWVNIALCALVTGAVFLFHFRVALFYVLLLALTVPPILWSAWKKNIFWSIAGAIVAIGSLSVLFVVPVLLDATVDYYLTYVNNNQVDFPDLYDEAMTAEFERRFYSFSLEAVPILAARTPWLIGVGLASLWLLWRRNKLVMLLLVWIGLLSLMGAAHLLGIQAVSITNMGAVLIMMYVPLGLIFGLAVQELVIALPLLQGPRATAVIIAALFLLALPLVRQRMIEVEPNRFFVTAADLDAAVWIRNNTPADALFAVNTVFWLPLGPHGTDGGYWLPYLSERKTTAGTMLTAVSFNEHHVRTVQRSRLVNMLPTDVSVVGQLKDMGVSYIYAGNSGFTHLPRFDTQALSQSHELESVYENERVSLYRIK